MKGRKAILMKAVMLLSLYLGLEAVGSHAQQTRRTTVDIVTEGSVPPIPAWYACTRELEGNKPYDRQQANACLATILKKKYFRDGRIEAESSANQQVLRFILRSPSLRLAQVDYGIQNDRLAEFQDFLLENPDFLREGEIYEPRRDTRTAILIESFFRKIGVMATVSERLNLNYRDGTARLVYQIWSLPRDPSEPPHENVTGNCEKRVSNLNLTDVDDFTPISLIQRISKTQASSCFSEATVQQDEQTLRSTRLFTELHYSVDGPGPYMTISLHARTKPVPIEKITFEGYGTLNTQDLQRETDLGSLPLKVGEPYSCTNATHTVETLRNRYERKGQRVKISEVPELSSNGGLILTFQVLAYPADQLYLDGEQVDPNSGRPLRP